MTRTLTTMLLLALVVAAPALDAAPPHADWRTVRTEHFRVHYPAQLEEWAISAASKLESSRSMIQPLIGYDDPLIIDVLVMDPKATANGMVLPILNGPRMILWTNPPPSSSMIGYYEDWMELVIIHEQAHLTHLNRPSRNWLTRLRSFWFPLGPVLTKAPRWAIEGYATMIEGRLTGSGRPQGDGRAAILRKWALEGKLPSYERLSADSTSWMGMSMAYLVGSTYLEWLERRTDRDALPRLWARLTAVQQRSFNEAFQGVFGDSPKDLYDRFRVELTHDALAFERLMPEPVQGELWQDLSWSTEDPALSPDGTKLATVLSSRTKPDRLVVWETAEDEKAEQKYRERIEKILETDPDDVAPVRTTPPARRRVATLWAPLQGGLHSPEWTSEGEILYTRFDPDPDGMIHPDVYRWNPETGENVRLTVRADLREPAPIPNSRDFVAIRNRDGRSELVVWRGGAIDTLGGPSLVDVYGAPAVSPDGERVAFVRNVNGVWRLSIVQLDGGPILDLTLPAGSTTVSAPDWTPDGRHLFATVGQRGFFDLWRIPTDGGEPERFTLSLGGSLAPAVGRDQLYFLALESDGYDIRRLALDSAQRVELDLDAIEARAIGGGYISPDGALRATLGRPTREEPVRLEQGPVSEPVPYGIGKQEPFLLAGGGRAASHETFEAIIRIGDVVGRSNTLLVGSLSSGGPEGLGLQSRWRGLPFELGVDLYSIQRDLTQQPAGEVFPYERLDRTGLELVSERRWAVPSGSTHALIGAGWEDFDRDEVSDDETRAFGSLNLARGLRVGEWVLRGTGGITGFAAETDEGDLWIGGATLEGAVSSDLLSFRAGVGYRRGEADGEGPVVILGGVDATVQPRSDALRRWYEPALPFGLFGGETLETGWIEIGDELGAFYRVHWLDDADPIEIAGLKWELDLEEVPLIRVPGLSADAGVAYVFDEIVEDEVQWWLSFRWRP